MKIATKLFAAVIAAITFASCSQEPIYYDDTTGEQPQSGATTSYVYTDAKGGKSEPVYQPVVVEEEKHECTKCGSWFCPKPDCCDTVSSSVLSRATAQGGTGEPHIGLIPTMKTLAPQQ